MMKNDEIVEQVRAARLAHASQHDNDLKKIFADLKAQQDASGRPIASFPPRRPVSVASADSGTPRGDSKVGAA